MGDGGRRTVRRVRRAGPFAVLLAGLLVAASAAAKDDPAAAPPSWRTFRANSVSVRYPPSWFATARPLTAVTAPKQVLAIASYRFRPDIARADGCEPKEALDLLPPAGAFVYGWEGGRVGHDPGVHAPPRPEHFRLTGFGHYECLGPGPGYMLSFSDHGRAFTVEVAFGRKAGAARRSTVLRILDSFTAKP
jgi:hypothetical protein